MKSITDWGRYGGFRRVPPLSFCGGIQSRMETGETTSWTPVRKRATKSLPGVIGLFAEWNRSGGASVDAACMS